MTAPLARAERYLRARRDAVEKALARRWAARHPGDETWDPEILALLSERVELEEILDRIASLSPELRPLSGDPAEPDALLGGEWLLNRRMLWLETQLPVDAAMGSPHWQEYRVITATLVRIAVRMESEP